MNQVDFPLLPQLNAQEAMPVQPVRVGLSEAFSLVNFYKLLPISAKPAFEGSLIEQAEQIKTWMTGEGNAAILQLESLDLDNAELTELPAEIGLFRNLRSLGLMNNRLTRLPAEIGQLTELKVLILIGNTLTNLPHEIGRLINLEELELGSNHFTFFPNEIGSLTNLKSLNFPYNQLRSMPNSLAQFPHLRSLNLTTNQFTSIPDSILDLPTRCSVQLNENPLDPSAVSAFQRRNNDKMPELELDSPDEMKKLFIAEQLGVAIHNDDPAVCRRLIEDRADVNAKHQNGLTPLQLALSENRLQIAKVLVENAHVESLTDMQNLYKRTGGVTKIKPFLQTRPPLYVPQVFSNDTFTSLSSMSQEQLKMMQSSIRPLAIFNVADEHLGPDYGAVVTDFNGSFNSQYEKIARDFTVIRVLVDDPNQLVATTDRIRNMFPQAPVLHWAMNGHGNTTFMEVGGGSDDALLTINDNNILQEISTRVSPLGTIALWGCCCALGDQNLTRQFSLYGRVAYGSDHPVSTVEYETYDSTLPNTPLLLPRFSDKLSKEFKAKIYNDNKELAYVSTPHDLASVDRIIGALRAKVLSQTPVSEPEATTIHIGNDLTATDDPEIMALYQQFGLLDPEEAPNTPDTVEFSQPVTDDPEVMAMYEQLEFLASEEAPNTPDTVEFSQPVTDDPEVMAMYEQLEFLASEEAPNTLDRAEFSQPVTDDPEVMAMYEQLAQL